MSEEKYDVNKYGKSEYYGTMHKMSRAQLAPFVLQAVVTTELEKLMHMPLACRRFTISLHRIDAQFFEVPAELKPLAARLGVFQWWSMPACNCAKHAELPSRAMILEKPASPLIVSKDGAVRWLNEYVAERSCDVRYLREPDANACN